MEKQPDPQKSVSKDAQDNIFANAKSMILNSLGKLPTALVVILLISLAMATVTGLVMQLNKSPELVSEFMPLRLTPSEDAPPVDLRKLQGNWVYQTADYAMTLTFIGDRFEWILSLKDIPEAQFFSRGNFRVVGDILILGVRPDLGSPRDPAKPWMKYMPMSMKDLNAKFQQDPGKIIWNVPSSEQRKIISNSGRIFIGHEDGHIEWVKR